MNKPCYVNLYAKNRSLHKDIFKLNKYLIGTPCSMHKLSRAITRISGIVFYIMRSWHIIAASDHP